MITLIQKGTYEIVSTKDHGIMMILDDQRYLRSYAPKIGDLLTYAKSEHAINYYIARGNYRIYRVKDEPNLVDLDHLERSLGRGMWQGYLLLTKLPTAKKICSRIVPTNEIISGRKCRE